LTEEEKVLATDTTGWSGFVYTDLVPSRYDSNNNICSMQIISPEEH